MNDSVPRAHKAHAPAQVAFAVVTCSDSRDAASDTSGDVIEEALLRAGHRLVSRTLVKDDAERIRAAAERAARDGARVIIVTGGTGLAPRDVTPEALRPLIAKELPGFGELFRMLSFSEIGAAAIASRAFAGATHEGALIFALPGSRAAVALAVEKLILPELGHLVSLAGR